MKTLSKINNNETLNSLYENYERLIKKILEEEPFKGGALNIIQNEWGFPNHFKKNDINSIKNKFIERIYAFKKNGNEITIDNEANFRNFSIEDILNNNASSFKFIFEGKAYYLKNDPKYLEKLINEGYLSKNFLENAKKRYDEFIQKNESLEYKSFDEFIEKVTIPITYQNYVLGTVTLDRKTKDIDFEKFIDEFRKKYEDIFSSIYFKTDSLNFNLQKDIYKLKIFEEIIEKKEKTREYTIKHSEQVNDLYLDFIKYLSIKKKIKLTSKDYLELKLGSYFHDIGKISIPSEILLKPTKLTPEEYEIIKDHPINGFKYLNDVSLPSKTTNIILLHHELINGKGYPFMIKNIPEYVQYFTIVDIFEAIVSKRPYKKEKNAEEAINILKEEAMLGKLNYNFVVDFEEYINYKSIELSEKKILDKKEEKIKEMLKK
ncbi:MAG: HD domain-containing protein [Candidatus Woesearchaeota archaeon]